MGHQCVHVAFDFPGGFLQFEVLSQVALQEGDGPLGVHQTEADFAVAVFEFGEPVDGFFEFGVVVFQDHVADVFEFAVDVFEDVGEVFDFLLEHGDHQVLGRAGLDLAAPGAHAQQAEVREVAVAQGDEAFVLKDERDGHGAVAAFSRGKKQGVNVQAGGVLEVAGGEFDFFHVVGFGQFGPQEGVEQFAFFFGGFVSVDPDRIIQCGFEVVFIHGLVAQGCAPDIKHSQHGSFSSSRPLGGSPTVCHPQ